MPSELIFPAFVAGLLTFLAPCTLPLIPGYLAFISGIAPEDLENPETSLKSHLLIFWNGLLYVIGFSVVFIVFGSVFALGGSSLAQHQDILARIGGVVVILFGVYLIGGSSWKIFAFLNSERKLHINGFVKPGRPLSSLLFGAVFAFGWSPCIGPVLGTILLLASTTGTAAEGAFLLSVFAIGLGIPFLLLAIAFSSATLVVKKLTKYLGLISKIGGVFLIALGLLLLFDQLSVWYGFAYKIFGFLNYEGLLDFL